MYVTFASGCNEREHTRPLTSGAKHYGGKDTAFFLKDKVYLKKHTERRPYGRDGARYGNDTARSAE